MRIVFLLSISLDSPSALGRWFPWAREMACRGHDVHVLALHHDLRPEVPRRFEREGVQVHYVGQMHTHKVGDTTHYFGPLRLLWVAAAGAWGLARQAAALRADVYHVCKPHPQNSLAGWLAARVWNKRPLFLDCDDLEARINRFSGGWQRRALAWLERRMPHRVDGVTVHTRFLERRVRESGVPPARILRVPTAIDASRLGKVSAADAARWHERLQIGERRVVAYVGTMALVSHAVDLLLTAFAHLARRREDVVLLLAGGGPDLEALKALAAQLGIAGRCRFTGRVPPAEIPSLLSLACASVDPVHDDEVARARWPVKIMESMALGVPVVTGDVGDRREMLGQGTAGVLVAPGDPAALADGLEEVLGDPLRCERLVAGCKAQAKGYALEDMVSLLLDFYESSGEGA